LTKEKVSLQFERRRLFYLRKRDGHCFILHMMGSGSARKREKHYVLLGCCVRLLRPLHLGVIMQWRTRRLTRSRSSHPATCGTGCGVRLGHYPHPLPPFTETLPLVERTSMVLLVEKSSTFSWPSGRHARYITPPLHQPKNVGTKRGERTVAVYNGAVKPDRAVVAHLLLHRRLFM